MKNSFMGDLSFNRPFLFASLLSVVVVFALAGSSVPHAAGAVASPCIMTIGQGSKTVDIAGSSKITATDCSITALTSATPAISAVGSSKISASAVCAKSISTSGSSKVTPANDVSCATGSDPFATEQEPAVGECNYTNLSYTNSSNNTLHPGVYCGNVFLGGSTKNTLSPGVYIIKNGSFKVDGSAQVSGNGVVLFFTGSGGGLLIGGSSKLSLTAPTTGTLKGFAIYLDPAAPAAQQSTITGSSQITLNGITYLPTQTLVVEGSSKIVASTLTTFVLKAIQVRGSSNVQAVGTLPTGPTPDITPPVIASHDDVTVIGTVSGAIVNYTIPTSTDDIDGSVTVSCLPATGSNFALGTTPVSCTAHDAAGNNATPTVFNVIVTLPPDTRAPDIAPHADVIVGGTLSGVVVNYTVPTSTDDKDPVVNVVCTPASGSLFAFGTTTVTCNARDTAGNNAIPTVFDVIVVDQVAPIIAPHENISVIGNSLGANVAYTIPTATDDVDTSVAVACSPISGSTFTVGTTTVFCNAQDHAGNIAAATSFDVGVFAPPPVPFIMAQQADESYLCSPDWQNCFTGGLGQANILLGQGSTLGAGSLLSVTIAKDETSPFASVGWIIQLQCYTDSAYTITCPDWVDFNAWNGFRSYFVTEAATSSTDGKHWTAYFTDPTHETGAGGVFPVQFNPNYYYKLVIDDNGYNIGAYGSQTLGVPYYVITGMTL